MKSLIFTFLILALKSNVLAQDGFISFGFGKSNFTSNFENRYCPSYNFTLKTGYERKINKLGIPGSIGYYHLSSKIIENQMHLIISLVKFSSGLVYHIDSSWSFLGQVNIGKTTQKSVRIFSPSYNYDFDPFDISYSVELLKKLSLGNCENLSLGLEFSKSINGIIGNNFWEKDNLKPYYINANIYYNFRKK